MVSNHINNTSNNRTEFKCSLCGKSLINRDPSEIIQESISGSKYFFDTNQCVTMFKRLDHFYGKNITSFTGNTEIISDPFWNKIAPSYDEIREIDIESKDHYIHVIKNPQEALATAIQLVRSAEKEILLLFSSANAFYRRINQADGFELIKKIKDDPSKNVNIRILTPFDEKIQTTVDNLKNDYSIDVEYLPEPLHLNITILITDRRFSLAVELQKEKDSAEDSIDAMGLSTYSNSKSTVLYYVSIFENLWKQADIYKKADDLYRQLKETHQTQRQFINEAAHEIRNPIQPILGLAEVMLSNKNLDPDKKEDLLRIIVSNAKKLQFLTDNLLDVARIDGQLLTLNLEEFDLMESIRDLLRDLENQTKGKNISLVLNSKEKSVKLVADKLRVNQVFLNIINNAIDILQEGQVIVSVQSQNNDVLVKITDNGPGIQSKIKDKLFTKFVTGSKSGTGLGLYICKNIIEKHGGKIWAENNQDKGATFSFTVPIKTEK